MAESKRLGGKRPGAGRKPLGKDRVMLKISPAINQALEEQARKQAITRSEYAEQAIREKIDKTAGAEDKPSTHTKKTPKP